MVIPRHSPFRKNMDWLDTNFPREVKRKINKSTQYNEFYFWKCIIHHSHWNSILHHFFSDPDPFYFVWGRQCANTGGDSGHVQTTETFAKSQDWKQIISGENICWCVFFNLNGQSCVQWFMWFLVFGLTICFIMSLMKYSYPISPTRKNTAFSLYIHLNNLLIWRFRSTLGLFDFKKWILKRKFESF